MSPEIICKFIKIMSENKNAVCSGDGKFNTFESVKQNPLYIKFIKDLMQKTH